MASEPASDPFLTTRWSLVRAAAGDDVRGERALQELCSVYWYPLYAYIRRRGYSREDAEDLTQAFLGNLLERGDFRDTDPQAGKFRAWLLAALKNFLANDHDRRTAAKRGGGCIHLSFDWTTADRRFQLAGPEGAGPEECFDREWARALLETVLRRLEKEWREAGRSEQFALLKPCLTVSGEMDAAAGEALGLSPVALRVAVHRLRLTYRRLLKEEITHTLGEGGDAEEELRALAVAFRT
ncbi:MAG: sigma-70 family RNA polymerase sigma factor [Chthoniobacterales bacterium]|nr:sigma-70 family RNA polymerase sigma factor [Chthoniobacterales bacterium]